MKTLLPVAVLLLMISIGMSLRPAELLENWRRMSASAWLRLLLATFVIPPLLVLAAARLLPMHASALVGLFMVAVAPGAPLLTRNVGARGFDVPLAASYQVWGALLTPIMLPLTVAAVGKLYDRDIWISPVLLLQQIAEKQFIPLLLGIALMYLLPALGRRIQPGINLVGNLVLVVVIVAFLIKMWPVLRQMSIWVFVIAMVLAAGSIAAMMVLFPERRAQAATLAISNANRHVGLALLLSGQYLHNQFALPAIAAYALLAPLSMIGFAKWAQKHVIAPSQPLLDRAA